MKDLVNKFRDDPRFDHLLKIRPDLAPQGRVINELNQCIIGFTKILNEN